ncbi:MAG TPA: hypothetical protein VFT76_00460 [Actinomycetota bacterium]|nr:hypothetical protein [Actinomycetota bacterium]
MIIKGIGLAVIALATAAIATGTNGIPEVNHAADAVRTRVATAVDQDATRTSQTQAGCDNDEQSSDRGRAEDSDAEERQTRDEEAGSEGSGSEERQTRDEEAQD